MRSRHGHNAAVRSGELATSPTGAGSGQDTASWPLPPLTSSVRPARRLAGEQLEHWGFGHHRDTAELLVSELVTNAVRHGDGQIHLTMCAQDDRLRFEVDDEAPGSVPKIRPAGDNDEGGRGLHLVGLLSSRWGVTPTATGKIVWFELQTRRPPQDNETTT
ncbi:ATP-binding protein [Actinoallomurus purpureus]|uniref:ATP-binding protein n=1 Tax=Actinoallomurus purpureus TaxID=478114 RepID=UPI0020936EE7|nr:ATP-binding protein [Actinoallomurus purpureus]MCO6009197.1 ATP-binding protein [Actinoallomurus purpureus]